MGELQKLAPINVANVISIAVSLFGCYMPRHDTFFFLRPQISDIEISINTLKIKSFQAANKTPQHSVQTNLPTLYHALLAVFVSSLVQVRGRTTFIHHFMRWLVVAGGDESEVSMRPL